MGRKKDRLLMFVVFLGLGLSAESVRTHERFSQTTYYANPNSFDPMETPVDPTIPSTPKEEDTIPGQENKDESKVDFMPTEVKQPGGTNPVTYMQGDFTADARPWWVSPEYQNYGNSPLGKEPSMDRFPNTFDPRYFNNYQRPRGSFNQFVDNQNEAPANYAQYNNRYDVPYELSGGGCPTEYWISTTQRWPAFFNTKSTVGDAFGTPAVKVFGKTTIMQALLDTHSDGYHSLARNGCTALLNSYTRHQFKFTHQKVIESFNAALISNKVAARQAALFDEANLSPLSQQYNSCV